MNALTVPFPANQAAKPAAPFGPKLLPAKLPRDLAAEADRSAVVAECRQAVEAEKAATLPEFALTIERLALHYPENRLSERERLIVMEDWRRLLGHLPADILAKAADDWIMSPARFFPTPGQLAELAASPWKLRQLLARRARETLELIGSVS